jgi:hypothetical protein
MDRTWRAGPGTANCAYAAPWSRLVLDAERRAQAGTPEVAEVDGVGMREVDGALCLTRAAAHSRSARNGGCVYRS